MEETAHIVYWAIGAAVYAGAIALILSAAGVL